MVQGESNGNAHPSGRNLMAKVANAVASLWYTLGPTDVSVKCSGLGGKELRHEWPSTSIVRASRVLVLVAIIDDHHGLRKDSNTVSQQAIGNSSSCGFEMHSTRHVQPFYETMSRQNTGAENGRS